VADDLLAAVRERAQANLFWQYLGIEVEAAGEGWVRLRVPVRDGLRNATGAPVHGGVLATLVDLNVSFVGAARGDTLLAEGRIIRRGRTIAFGETRVTDSAGNLVALGRATYMIIAPR